ncbi:DNA adenine methylase [Staphylococcus simulans]|uniref:DNA adenine methylase n=1 Tax=Staphylococcus simulans TaxID=1286 RepID=UPI001E55A08E|nr:DNA adenine methylase [Staphylococcus simulans]MCD8916257.1 DNA adenine methylase [Staphylococcus simulans]
MHPFVKWAGGKRQYLPKILEQAPQNFESYIEPFVGGGAVLFGLNHSNSFANDINTHLIHTYNEIKKNPNDLIAMLSEYDNIPLTTEKYQEIRSIYNNHILEERYDTETAVLFIFLNKHSFNGLYRVNKKGLFNVPWNKKEFAASFDKDNILQISNFLQNVTLTSTDFEEVALKAQRNDFVFFDSPYAPINPTSFTSYDKTGFKLEDHIRLSEVFKTLDERGVYCMLTNHNTDLIQDLYKDFNIEEINVRRSINSVASKRTGKELIIKNY